MSGRSDQAITRLVHWTNLLKLDLAPDPEVDDFIANAIAEFQALQAEIRQIEGLRDPSVVRCTCDVESQYPQGTNHTPFCALTKRATLPLPAPVPGSCLAPMSRPSRPCSSPRFEAPDRRCQTCGSTYHCVHCNVTVNMYGMGCHVPGCRHAKN